MFRKIAMLAPVVGFVSIAAVNAPVSANAQTAPNATYFKFAPDLPATIELAARKGGGGGGHHGGGGGRHGGGGGKHAGGGKHGGGKHAGGGGGGGGKHGGGKSTMKSSQGGKDSKGGAGGGKNAGNPNNQGGGKGKLNAGPAMKGGPNSKFSHNLNNKKNINIHVNVFRNGHRLWWGNRWVTFVGIGTLAALTFGAVYYDPWGYVPIGRPYCAGVSPSGCRLSWQGVALVEGGEQMQCVEYCPRGKQITDATVPLTANAEQAQARGQCDLTIYSDPNRQGTSAPTSEDQPKLSEVGWKDEIQSIEVKSGTWDFYQDENYGGGAMRLAPGNYDKLSTEWNKHIGSFQCSNPA